MATLTTQSCTVVHVQHKNDKKSKIAKKYLHAHNVNTMEH